MNVTVTIPTLETDRLILRAPRLADSAAYVAFKTSPRAKFTGGLVAADVATGNFVKIAGQWMLRGYGLFMATLKGSPDTPIGGFGVFHTIEFAEPEFGWSLWAGEHEGQGYVTEAMRKIIPWAWDVMGVDTAQSHIDEGNDASVAVAKRLGATLDARQTEIANAPGGEFYSDDPADRDDPLVNIWRHHRGALI
jgi:RimJ/RimL family protein N-acetyltransferase